jgi:hypothetical protein
MFSSEDIQPMQSIKQVKSITNHHIALSYDDFISQFAPNTKFYKIINNDFKHYNFEYKLGLNVDTIPFNPKGTCKPGGLYFSDEKNIQNYFQYGDYIVELKLLPDAVYYVEDKKYKTNRLYICKVVSLINIDKNNIRASFEKSQGNYTKYLHIMVDRRKERPIEKMQCYRNDIYGIRNRKVKEQDIKLCPYNEYCPSVLYVALCNIFKEVFNKPVLVNVNYITCDKKHIVSLNSYKQEYLRNRIGILSKIIDKNIYDKSQKRTSHQLIIKIINDILNK